MDHEDREDAILARSREILENEPTPEELAEHEARRHANKIARIMEPSPPPPVITKIRPDALQQQDVAPGRDGRPGSGGGVASRNARRDATPLTDREDKLVAWWATRITDLLDRLAQARLPEVTREFLRELAGVDVAAARRLGKAEEAARKRHRTLKRRVKALEQAYAEAREAKPRSDAKQAKPRVRVKAAESRLAFTEVVALKGKDAPARPAAGEWNGSFRRNGQSCQNF